MPDLAAALDACAGLGTVNVEIKNWPADVDFDPSLAVVDRVVDALLARPATERAAFLVSGFHLPTVDRVRAPAPELATGWLVIGPGIGPEGAPLADGRWRPDRRDDRGGGGRRPPRSTRTMPS